VGVVTATTYGACKLLQDVPMAVSGGAACAGDFHNHIPRMCQLLVAWQVYHMETRSACGWPANLCLLQSMPVHCLPSIDTIQAKLSFAASCSCSISWYPPCSPGRAPGCAAAWSWSPLSSSAGAWLQAP
jgi:hypothetical protein